MKRYLLSLPLVLGATMSYAADTSMYPAPAKGEHVHVIELPKQANEGDMTVEVMPGKQLKVDCNQQMLRGTSKQHDVEGWGYSYYRVSAIERGASTLMACPEGATRQRFVAAHNASFSVAYNSRLPVVVYAPADVEVRYRVWKAEPTWHNSVGHPQLPKRATKQHSDTHSD
ncbi:Ecotin [Carnimonas sp. R-84981]